MLYIVLALVLAALGLLIAALTTANTIWAWVSVTVSVVAAAMLIADWVGARRRSDSKTAPMTSPATTPAAAATTRAAAPDEPRDPARVLEQSHGRAPEPEPIPLVEQTVQHERFPALPPPDEEPGEEATDASDLLVVSELTIEVRVVDEHPRYHLGSCAWLRDKPTLPLPVNEARQLGFSPCAYCGPDAVLAARHRAARRP